MRNTFFLLVTLVALAVAPSVGCEKCCPQPTAPTTTAVVPPAPPTTPTVTTTPPTTPTPAAPTCVYAVANPTLTVPGVGGRYGMSINTSLGNVANPASCPWTLRSNNPGSLDLFLNAQYTGRAVQEVTNANGSQVWFVVTGTGTGARNVSFTLTKADGSTQTISITQSGRTLTFATEGVKLIFEITETELKFVSREIIEE